MQNVKKFGSLILLLAVVACTETKYVSADCCPQDICSADPQTVGELELGYNCYRSAYIMCRCQ